MDAVKPDVPIAKIPDIDELRGIAERHAYFVPILQLDIGTDSEEQVLLYFLDAAAFLDKFRIVKVIDLRLARYEQLECLMFLSDSRIVELSIFFQFLHLFLVFRRMIGEDALADFAEDRLIVALRVPAGRRPHVVVDFRLPIAVEREDLALDVVLRAVTLRPFNGLVEVVEVGVAAALGVGREALADARDLIFRDDLPHDVCSFL